MKLLLVASAFAAGWFVRDVYVDVVRWMESL